MNTIPLFYPAWSYCCFESMYITVAVIDLTKSVNESGSYTIKYPLQTCTHMPSELSSLQVVTIKKIKLTEEDFKILCNP